MGFMAGSAGGVVKTTASSVGQVAGSAAHLAGQTPGMVGTAVSRTGSLVSDAAQTIPGFAGEALSSVHGFMQTPQGKALLGVGSLIVTQQLQQSKAMEVIPDGENSKNPFTNPLLRGAAGVLVNGLGKVQSIVGKIENSPGLIDPKFNKTEAQQINASLINTLRTLSSESEISTEQASNILASAAVQASRILWSVTKGFIPPFCLVPFRGLGQWGLNLVVNDTAKAVHEKVSKIAVSMALYLFLSISIGSFILVYYVIRHKWCRLETRTLGNFKITELVLACETRWFSGRLSMKQGVGELVCITLALVLGQQVSIVLSYLTLKSLVSFNILRP
uniref:Uncharacterized protein orf332 n=1 Tax=Neglectella solitaria TaxID=120749 RepID=C7BEJ9_NEGSO|nr:hypothetical protein [Neglectella solitaria]